MTAHPSLPILILGAGPIGLAAAAKCARRGLDFLLVEAGREPASAVREWRHVRLFSPWSECIDDDAADLLAANGWRRPDLDLYPDGAGLVADYLAPLAAVPQIRSRLRLETRILRYRRRGIAKHQGIRRFEAPFEAVAAGGKPLLGRALIDATGNWSTPRRLGGSEAGPRIRYGIPDLTEAEVRRALAGRTAMVIGAGHSGMTTIIELASMKPRPERIVWLRRSGPAASRSYPPGSARLRLEQRAEAAARAAGVEIVDGVSVSELRDDGRHVTAVGNALGGAFAMPADIAFVAAGFRPDLSLAAELWTAFDHRWEAPAGLADLIDPDKHSCSTVPAHGAIELAHPERDFFIVGAKSYGRAPNFALEAGYSQLDSVIAYMAGEPEKAASRSCRRCAA